MFPNVAPHEEGYNVRGKERREERTLFLGLEKRDKPFSCRRDPKCKREKNKKISLLSSTILFGANYFLANM